MPRGLLILKKVSFARHKSAVADKTAPSCRTRDIRNKGMALKRLRFSR
jgi:hypothetical protein